MATVESPLRVFENAAELIERLGGVPPERVMVAPIQPGRATEADVLAIHRSTRRLFELVDGVLVEKAMGYRESFLAGILLTLLNEFVLPRNLGVVTGEAGMMRLFPGLVRIPDVAFASWDRLPGRKLPDDPIPDLSPDLVVEVLSESNRPGEITRKVGEYFGSGVRLLWIIDPADRTARVFSAPDQVVAIDESGTLDGGDTLPGFIASLGDLFGMLDRGGES